MATDPNIHPFWARDAKKLSLRVNELDYYEILDSKPSDPLTTIKERYHSLQREYHPDTFFQSPDEELKEAVFVIAKRLAEAWVVIRDPDMREKYTRDISGPDRAKRLRFTEATEKDMREEKKREVEAVYGKTPQVQNLVRKALAAMAAGDLKNAQRDLKTARLFELDNQSIKEKLAEIEIKLLEKPKPKS